MSKRLNRLVSALSWALALASVTLIITLAGSELSPLTGLSTDEVRALAISLTSAILALWLIPKWQVKHLSEFEGISAKDALKAENDARTTLAQILGGLFFWNSLRFLAELAGF
jgi:hypothetical protein